MYITMYLAVCIADLAVADQRNTAVFNSQACLHNVCACVRLCMRA